MVTHYWDSHCHLNLCNTKDIILEHERIKLICPATHLDSFENMIAHCLNAKQYFTLGIHPLFSQNMHAEHIIILKKYIIQYLEHPYFVGVGEIGLDGVSNIHMAQQLFVFKEQLKLANNFELPVILHIRKAQDMVLKYIKIYNPRTGIAHAFNGSIQQANAYIKQGLKLGFGGNITFERALNIHKLLKYLSIEHIVLETDAPDMPPSWAKNQANTPLNIKGIYACYAQIKNIEVADLQIYMHDNINKIYFNDNFNAS
jgi:TatD DNase family protein